MTTKKSVGRPPKINYRTVIRLADSLQHNSTITEACRFAGISRQTYYHYLNIDDVFSIKMEAAINNQNKAVFSFLTTY